ncbi:uncharacterized protein LOC131859325 [Cryptomeria japonica]|uniref:uncharacterized protein LOC131859325 n=1 Tax=Cryptomeria japonica TaxID=3369 RepID=UPI0027DA2E0E|nr:uncharacterized protein LOC131859325 [Cryptomeria japonica]
MTFNLETRTEEEERASVSENTSHSTGSKRKNEQGKKEASKKKQKTNSDQPPSASSRHEKENQGKDQRIDEGMVHKVDESIESTIQNDKNDRQDKGKMPQESSNPALHIQICDDEEQGDNNEETSPPRNELLLKEVQVREGRSSIPEWLKERLTKEVIEEEEEKAFDLESLLNEHQEVIERRKAPKMLKIIRDDAGSKKIEIATPAVDKYEDEITAEEYDLETFDLGPLTSEQAMEEATDSVKAVNEKLKAEIERNIQVCLILNANFVSNIQGGVSNDVFCLEGNWKLTRSMVCTKN